MLAGGTPVPQSNAAGGTPAPQSNAAGGTPAPQLNAGRREARTTTRAWAGGAFALLKRYAAVMSDRSDGSGGGARRRDQIIFYFGALTLFVYLATPGGYLIDIQTSYLLKNQFHASPKQIANFRLLTAIPVYLAFIAGLIRDQWNPLGLRDRGFFLIFAPATVVALIAMALAPDLTYRGLFLGMLVVMLASRFISAAYEGLMALVGQESLMSGRLSVVWNVFSSIPVIGGALASGYISGHLRPTAAFYIVACFAGCIGLLGLWKPASVFRGAYDKPHARSGHFLENVKRLARHRPVYPAVLICFLWNFAPGCNTPLQFYLTKLGASDAVYSYFNAIFTAANIPTYLLYGFLCRRVSLNKLLWWSTIIAVPQWVPMIFMHSANLVLVLVVPIGLMGGMATAAYADLAMRSCPRGLQGTLMMLVAGVFSLSARGGDVLGSAIYNASPEHGFLYCVIAITVVYALILPLLLLVPKELTARADGEETPAHAASAVEEVAI
jgi:hypothetical protein